MHLGKRGAVRGLASVDLHGEPAPAVPADGDIVAAVAEVVKNEVVPRRGAERIDREAVRALRHEADESRDHQVAERRVVVVLAALAGLLLALKEERAGDPVRRVGIHVLVDPGHCRVEPASDGIGGRAVQLVSEGVLPHQEREALALAGLARAGVETVDVCRERDGGRERPARSVPLALVPLVGDCEALRAALWEREPVLGGEALLVEELLPVGRDVKRHPEIPRRVAVQLAHRCQGTIPVPRGEELEVAVPALRHQRLADALGLRLELRGKIRLTDTARDGGNALRLAPHRRVEERLPSAAAERDLRALVSVQGHEPALAVAAHDELAPLLRNALFPAIVELHGVVEQRGGQVVQSRDFGKLARPRVEPA